MINNNNLKFEGESEVRIAMVTLPWKSKAPEKFVKDMIKILSPITKHTFIIYNKSDLFEIQEYSNIIYKKYNHTSKLFSRNISNIESYGDKMSLILEIFIIEIKMTIEIFKIRNQIDIIIFYVSWPFYLIPLILCKILKKPSIDIVTRSMIKEPTFSEKLLFIQDKLLMRLIDYISPETDILIKNNNLIKYKDKFLDNGSRFVDTKQFICIKKINERPLTIGYIGRLEESKGVLNLIEVYNYIKPEIQELKLFLGGTGSLYDMIKKEYSNQKNIIMPGWIPNEDISKYLNEIRLFIFLSKSEGLPTIILEGMACGTPVLSNKVGGILDVIQDNITGYLIKNDSPKCIADQIYLILQNLEELEKISIRSREYILKNYSYNKCLVRFRNILSMKKREN